jgi:Integrase core domain
MPSKPDLIHPGKPTEGGRVESFDACLRNEFLNVAPFVSIDDA